MQIKVFNTLTRLKEDFKTVKPGRVGMYVCGPTVYKPSHVGHMVGPVIFDTIKRGDILLHHPYNNFEPVIQLLEQEEIARQKVSYRKFDCVGK